MAGLFLTLFIGEMVTNYQPAKLSVLFVLGFWVPLLVLHEGGHAAMAALLGSHVGQIVIGMGNVVHTFHIGSAVVEIRLLPLEGFVRQVPTNLHLPQLKSALIYFAGPAANLIVAGGVLAIIGPERLFTASEDYVMIAWQSLALTGAMQGVLNLIPHYIETADGFIPNDGLGIIRSFMLPDSYYASMIGWRYNEREGEWEEGDENHRWS
jgi:membrane-associated protease RseP (regulator of RpoE activity)